MKASICTSTHSWKRQHELCRFSAVLRRIPSGLWLLRSHLQTIPKRNEVCFVIYLILGIYLELRSLGQCEPDYKFGANLGYTVWCGANLCYTVWVCLRRHANKHNTNLAAFIPCSSSWKIMAKVDHRTKCKFQSYESSTEKRGKWLCSQVRQDFLYIAPKAEWSSLKIIILCIFFLQKELIKQ